MKSVLLSTCLIYPLYTSDICPLPLNGLKISPPALLGYYYGSDVRLLQDADRAIWANFHTEPRLCSARAVQDRDRAHLGTLGELQTQGGIIARALSA